MPEITKLNLYLLRAMYFLISVGLVLTVWPEIIAPYQRLANQDSVIESLLGALALLAIIGIRYPLKMLPILIFELIWKLIFSSFTKYFWLAVTFHELNRHPWKVIIHARNNKTKSIPPACDVFFDIIRFGVDRLA